MEGAVCAISSTTLPTVELQSRAPSWPRIALVTPVLNSEKYIDQTIRSVLIQDYPNLEYFIVDGGSTDGTVEIIRKYEDRISGWISEPDKGMYDAINKGFARTQSEVMGWISATDQLHVGALRTVGGVFRDLPAVKWITGRRTGFNEDGVTVKIDPLLRWTRYRFLIGGSGQHIQQESTYWRRSLWDKAGANVDGKARIAGDFELWVRFFRHADLCSVDGLIGGFREHPGSGSLQNLEGFNVRCEEIAEAELRSIFGGWLSAYQSVDQTLLRIPGARGLWFWAKQRTMDAVHGFSGRDLPPVIEHGRSGWRIRNKT
jgi:glycosyltransferase involved in cell wall biosynthesis